MLSSVQVLGNLGLSFPILAFTLPQPQLPLQPLLVPSEPQPLSQLTHSVDGLSVWPMRKPITYSYDQIAAVQPPKEFLKHHLLLSCCRIPGQLPLISERGYVDSSRSLLCRTATRASHRIQRNGACSTIDPYNQPVAAFVLALHLHPDLA